ncbi:MAG: MalY/PatB family protein [Eubacterium sp.]
MSYNFDEIINRIGTFSVKHDFIAERGMPADVLPLWVADMDFRAPQEVIDRLLEITAHGIYGYSELKGDYFDTLHTWFQKRFNWSVDRSWLIETPGVIFAISTAIRSLTEIGDAILIQRPVYSPFAHSILINERKLVNNPLIFNDGRYTINFDDFEQKIIDNNVKLFILCSPHNPVGRVWTSEELERIGDICLKHHVFVIADEIHADFIYSGHVHHIFATVKPEFEAISIICTAPSKTFNLAGLQASNTFIPNPDIRRKFKKEIACSGFGRVSLMGLSACQTAYTYGETWLSELKDYLASNLNFIQYFLNENLPEIHLIKPEGTYLVWIDFRALALSPDDLQDLIVNKARLWLNRGSDFGSEGEGFERFNIACPKSILEEAFTRLKLAIEDLNQ